MPSAFIAARALDVLVVVERGQRGRLGQPVHVERMARALQIAGELGIGDAVADAHAGEPVDLREGAQHDRAGPPRAATRARPGSRGRARELDVGLVDGEHERRPAATPTKRVEGVGADARAGRVVRIADEDDACVRGVTARASAGRSCTSPPSSGTRTGVAPMPCTTIGYIANEGHAKTHSSPGPRNAFATQLEDLVGAAAEDELLGRRRRAARPARARSCEARAVRIAVHAAPARGASPRSRAARGRADSRSKRA